MAGYDGDHLALELINSERWYGRRPVGGEDSLDDPRWLSGYVERWRLGDLPEPTQRDLSDLKTLRTVLRRAYTDGATRGSVSAEDLVELDRVVANALVRRRAVADGAGYSVALEPAARDWGWVRAEIAASFVELLASREPERMKLCENPECRCAFYDESKNRSRRWCYPQVCGNLYKVRRFRERQRTRSRARQARPN